LRSTAEWEKEKHTHTHTEGIQQTLPKKGQKDKKKNKNKVNTVKNLKKGTQCFHFKNVKKRRSKPSLLARTGKERKIIMIIRATSTRFNYTELVKRLAGRPLEARRRRREDGCRTPR